MKHPIPYRLILSVIAGIAATMFLTMLTHIILNLLGQHPPIFKPMLDDNQVQFDLVYHSIYAIIGAMVTAKIAKNQSRKAVLVLGTKELFMWVVGAFILYDQSPTWYSVTKALLGIPLAWLGGRLYEYYRKRKLLVQARRFSAP